MQRPRHENIQTPAQPQSQPKPAFPSPFTTRLSDLRPSLPCLRPTSPSPLLDHHENKQCAGMQRRVSREQASEGRKW